MAAAAISVVLFGTLGDGDPDHGTLGGAQNTTSGVCGHQGCTVSKNDCRDPVAMKVLHSQGFTYCTV